MNILTLLVLVAATFGRLHGEVLLDTTDPPDNDISSNRGIASIKSGHFELHPIVDEIDNPYVGGNWMIVNSSNNKNIMTATDRDKPHGCTITSVFETECNIEDNSIPCGEKVAATNGHCLSLYKHEYKQWEEWEKDDYKAFRVCDNNFNVIGEVIYSKLNDSFDGMIFRIFDSELASSALDQIYKFGDTRDYYYIENMKSNVIYVQKILSAIMNSDEDSGMGLLITRVSARTGKTRLSFIDECDEGVQEWSDHVKVSTFNSGKNGQIENLYCFKHRDKGSQSKNGDCGSPIILEIIDWKQANTDTIKIMFGIQTHMDRNPDYKGIPSETVVAVQDIETFAKVMNVELPFKKIESKLLKDLLHAIENEQSLESVYDKW